MTKLKKTLQDIRTFIHEKGLIRENEKLLVAISGGPDSVFLAYALKTLGYTIGLVHINYQLRGKTSDDEEKLIIEYADSWNVPVYYRRMEKVKEESSYAQSRQVIYRDFRYDFFREIMQKHGYTKCATAHHRDDQAESILMSLTKGNHPAIIQSIPLEREKFVRPLLPVSKAEILECLAEAGLAYSHDISNDSNDYLRNQFRNQVIPLLKTINPSIDQQLVSKHEWYQQQFSFIQKVLDQQAHHYLEEKATVKRLYFEPFIKQFGEDFLQVLCIWAFERWGLHGKDIWETIKLIDSESGRFCYTSVGKISKGRDMLILETEEIESEIISIPSFRDHYSIKTGHQNVSFSILTEEKPDFKEKNTLWLDLEKIHFPIIIRRWEQGDKMIPLGMKRTKKISDIFIDLKFDSAQKDRAIVFISKGEIFALYPFRVSDTVKISSQTKAVLKIVIEA